MNTPVYNVGDRVEWDLWIFIPECAPMWAVRVGTVIWISEEQICVEYTHEGKPVTEAMEPHRIRHHVNKET